MAQEVKAHLKKGQVVLDEPLDVPEGTRLRVVPVDEDEERVEQAWLEEVRRRRSELRSGETQAVPWEEVEAELLRL